MLNLLQRSSCLHVDYPVVLHFHKPLASKRRTRSHEGMIKNEMVSLAREFRTER